MEGHRRHLRNSEELKQRSEDRAPQLPSGYCRANQRALFAERLDRLEGRLLQLHTHIATKESVLHTKTTSGGGSTIHGPSRP